MESDSNNVRSSAGSAPSGTQNARSSGSRSRQQQQQQQPGQTGPQQLSTIEKSVTHLLVATKQLLETLTQWSRGAATETEVSDVYVRLGYEFNIACRAFNGIGVDTNDLGPVPDLLRSILEETLSQEASQASLDKFLPRIRDIIINLLHGLKKKQQRLRQRTGSGGGGQSSRQASMTSNASISTADILGADVRPSSSRSYAQRGDSGDLQLGNGPDLPPRSTSVQGGRSSPRREAFSPSSSSSMHRTREPSRDTFNSDASASSMSSNAMQNIPVIAPYPQEDTMPAQPPQQYENEPAPVAFPPTPEPTTRTAAYDESVPLPPPPPPPKQQDALAALQRGGELERRASRRFSAYQFQKHLGSSNGIPIIPPAQNSPVPNRGKDARESMNAVRTRRSYLHSRQNSTAQRAVTDSPRRERPADHRISEDPRENGNNAAAPGMLQPQFEEPGSPLVKTPEDKLAPFPMPKTEEEKTAEDMAATLNGPMADPFTANVVDSNGSKAAEHEPPPEEQRRHKTTLSRGSNRAHPQQSTSQPQFVPEASPQPGEELTLFLQYKSKIKKFVLPDGGDLTIARLQLAFIEKFNWNTHSNGRDLPEIYIQDPASGIRHELEDLSDIRDRSVLVLNVEALDEVKQHLDEGLGGIRRLIEGIKTSVDDQQTALQRVSDKQQEAAKEIASLTAAAAPIRTPAATPAAGGPVTNKASASQLAEVESLRRDLAVVRQTYTSFVDDITASMTTIRTKASSVKTVAEKSSIPSMTANTGRNYVNNGKKNLSDDSEKLVTKVDDLQDTVEDLRKDVVSRGVRPLPRQLETVSKDISSATSALKKLQEFLKREKPVWTKIWEKELQVVCDDRDLLTMQEELCVDLEDDLEKAAATFALVEQATRQQNLQNASTQRVSSRTLPLALALDQGADPQKAKDGVLGEIRALQPSHETRLEAIERAEKARRKELESRRGGEFQKELGSFVEEGKLKKSGGVEEVERLRKLREERARKEAMEFMRERARAKAERDARAAEEAARAAEGGGDAEEGEGEGEAEVADGDVEAAPAESGEDAVAEEGAETAETEAAVAEGAADTNTAEAEATTTTDDKPEAVSEDAAATATAPAADEDSHSANLAVPGADDADVDFGVPSPEPEFVEAKEHPATPME